MPAAIPPPAAARRAARVLLGVTAASIPLSTTGMEAGVLGLLVLTAVALLARWQVVRRTPLDLVLGLFYGTLVLSTLASGHPREATGWASLWIGVTYFLTNWWIEDEAHAARLVRWLVLAATVAAAYGILQHFTGADWYRALLGRPIQVAPRLPGDERFAVIGFFRNYLTFAHVMIVPLAWATALALSGRMVAGAAAALIVVSIVFSTARGAWLAMVAVGVAFAVLLRARRRAVVIATLGAIAAIALLASPDLRAQARDMFALGGVNAPRLAIYESNLDIVHEHPVLGLGFGRYRTAALPYYAAHPEADRRSHAHNNFLHLAAEAGLLGLAAFVLVYASAFRWGWRAIQAARDGDAWATAAGAWAALIGFLVGGVTQYTFGDGEVAIAMWFALALLMRGVPDRGR
jgi:O-antigen ligase